MKKIEEILEKTPFKIEEIKGGRRNRHLVNARRFVVRELHDMGYNQLQIAEAINKTIGCVQYLLKK